MAQILVLVTSSPSASANPRSAFLYCVAALKKRHEVIVFFYSEGVNIANAFTASAVDESNLFKAFQELSENNSMLKLLVCNTAGNRRGLLGQEEANELGFNITKPFVLGGLAEFAQFSQSAHRVVQF